ncbi:Deoxyuridine 5'-triphosphate nucleotidohydrolase [Zancudomyces culisetae]|uniref:Deoxyuridine 5'-triphosphate nucleotidohydrolase n=1 Tax=Zancudomyces culisetae TaxID=1213189 RepID=A0A1R1PEB4_ZANCU|nr:Deoxyuridine 5'-triphosphate nucleotidohydrolase [Zancudomyces culisetae]|eukprot:OMH79258.1 Deoxyuridine 5'-triphosphate nucleotidohydrolase [Zancudomyces culisetae]
MPNIQYGALGRYAVDTGLIMKIPDNCYGRVAARSGLAVKHSIDVSAGVIDSDYRGIVKILLLNNGKTPFEIRIGDRIAQLILENISTPEISPAEDLAATEKTERGAGGFGSTGGFAGQ